MAGRVVGIYVSPGASEPMHSLSSADAIPGKGLKGDRYEAGVGFYSQKETTPGARDLTLIDVDNLEAVCTEHGIDLALEETRRNVATTGVDLEALLGKRFVVGDVVCEGVRDCPPCVHLDEILGRKVMKPLIRAGGLRARIVEGGTIQIDDELRELGDATGPFVGKGRE